MAILESNGYYAAPLKDALNVKLTYWGETTAAIPNHAPRFILKNSVGTVVKTGSLNAFQTVAQNEVPYEFLSTTNISTAGLPAGHFRVELSIVTDEGSLTSADSPTLTQGFTIDSARSLVNLRP